MQRWQEPDRSSFRSDWDPTADRYRLDLVNEWSRSFEAGESADWFQLPSAAGESDAAGPAHPPAGSDRAAALSGAAGLRFPQPVGFAAFWIPATGDATYDFEVSLRRAIAPQVRDADAAPALEREALVGGAILYEVPRAPARTKTDAVRKERLLAAVARRTAEHRIAARAAAGGVERLHESFRTSVLTQGLIVVLSAGMPRWWSDPRLADPQASPTVPAGPVDFDDLSLRRVPLRIALARDADVENPFVRKLALGGDLREALLAPPQTEIRLPLPLPRGRWRLRFGYGVADEVRPGAGSVPIRFAARLESSGGRRLLELPHAELTPARDVTQYGWHDCAFEGDGAGEAATLVLSTQVAADAGGPATTLDVAAFSAPRIVALDRFTAPPLNLLLVSLDTLRADRLGTYGYARADGLAVSPQIDAFARECLVFERAYSAAPYTLPSHASLFTGLLPTVHGVSRYESRLDPLVHPLLTQTVADAGFATAAFTAGGFLAPAFGFHHGFDRYTTLDPFLPPEDPFRNEWPRRDDRPFNDAMAQRCDRRAIGAWIAGHADEPCFAFVHSYVAHNYRPPSDVLAQFAPHAGAVPQRPTIPAGSQGRTDEDLRRLAEMSDRYDGTIFTLDRELGALLDELRAGGLLERTIVVITSDHGEELGDHGGLGHGATLYGEVLHVPLLLRIPGIPPARISEPVALVDLVPTLHAALKLAPPALADGIDLLSALRDDGWAQSWSAEVDDPRLGTVRALAVGSWKLIEHLAPGSARRGLPVPPFELFNLDEDPLETRSVLAVTDSTHLLPEDAQPVPFLRLKAQLRTEFERRMKERLDRDPDRSELDERTRAGLEAIGYLGDDDLQR